MMAKYIHTLIVSLTFVLFGHSAGACTYTINYNRTQPTCGSNGILNVSTTPAPSNGAIYKIYKDNSLLATIPGNSANLNSLAPGVYKIIVTHNASGCTDSIDNIVLDPAVNALSATYTADSTRCDTSKNGRIVLKHFNANMPVTYVWNHSASEKDSIAENLAVGTYHVTLTDKSNCQFIISDMKVKDTQQGILFLDTIITPTSCDSPIGKIDIKYSSRFPPYFVWRQEPGTVNNVFDSVHMPLDTLKPGFYTCYFTDSFRCREYFIKSIEVKKNLNPKAEIFGTDSLCINEGFGHLDVKILVGDSTQMTYKWNPGQTTKRINGIPSGSYMVTVTDAAGCIDTPKWTIYDYPPKVITLSSKTDQIVKGQELFITIDNPLGLYDIQWEPANKLRKTNNNAWVFPDVTTLYTMTAKYGPGCVTVANKTINIIAEKDDLVIPNVFTPNGDGRNEKYHLIGENNAIETFEVSIYDRWGNTVFTAADQTFVWDGTDSKGQAVMSGVYTYLIKYTVVSEPFNRKVKSGTILLEK